MNDFGSFFTGWAPQAYGIWTGVFMFAGWLLREYRATHKLSIEDRLARREGYARQVENLQIENRSLHLDLSKLRFEYDEYRRLCHYETDQLRGQVVELENQMAGMKRTFDQHTVSMARQFGITSGEGQS